MGYQLEGEPLQCEITELLSEGICFGAIQIPPDGQPIVLLNDRQTIGGYPKIGSALSLDAARMTQLVAGSTVHFTPISIHTAHRVLDLTRRFTLNRALRECLNMDDYPLSIKIEALLVARNPRHMQLARNALEPGYFLRAAGHLRDLRGTVIIGTGFPVTGTFETDGPLGAIALYDTLETLGAQPVIACGAPSRNRWRWTIAYCNSLPRTWQVRSRKQRKNYRRYNRWL